MKKRIENYPLMLIGILLIFAGSCKKDPSESTQGKNTAIFNPNLTYGSMTDQDGNVYKTITIGTQTWMAENLRTTKYRNGDIIPEITSNSEWQNSKTGAYCNYDNTSNNDTIVTFGRLYNWFSVSDSRNIAPTGWHVATDAEWAALITYFESKSLPTGDNLKEVGTTHWQGPSTANNNSGFTALPAGYRSYLGGNFKTIGVTGYWWSSTERYTGVAWSRYMDWSQNYTTTYDFNEGMGFSVRCVKD